MAIVLDCLFHPPSIMLRPLKEIVEGSEDEDMTGKSGSLAPVAEEHSAEADDSVWHFVPFAIRMAKTCLLNFNMGSTLTGCL